MKKIISLIIVFLITGLYTLKAEKLTWEGAVKFTHDKENEVAYIELNDIGVTGALEVTVFGGWNHSPSFGKLTRLFSFYHAAGENIVREYSTEIITAHGNIAKTYGIGDMIAHDNKIRIPLYKLNAYSATNLQVYIEIYSDRASLIKNNLSITETFSEDIGPRSINKRSLNSLAIGTTEIPNGYSLAVGGNAIFEEVQVNATSNWPDFVFEDNYKLKSLEELESFIKENKHLPGIPSAKQMEEEGVGLAEMNKLLLQKVEELILYSIEQHKIIQKQNEIFQSFEDRFGKLEAKF